MKNSLLFKHLNFKKPFCFPTRPVCQNLLSKRPGLFYYPLSNSPAVHILYYPVPIGELVVVESLPSPTAIFHHLRSEIPLEKKIRKQYFTNLIWHWFNFAADSRTSANVIPFRLGTHDPDRSSRPKNHLNGQWSHRGKFTNGNLLSAQKQ